MMLADPVKPNLALKLSFRMLNSEMVSRDGVTFGPHMHPVLLLKVPSWAKFVNSRPKPLAVMGWPETIPPPVISVPAPKELTTPGTRTASDMELRALRASVENC